MREEHQLYAPKPMHAMCVVLLVGVLLGSNAFSQSPVRLNISLNKNWLTAEDDNNIKAYDGFQNSSFKTTNWKAVDVPHNWDEYEGYRRLKHGDRHGYAWYRKNFAVRLTSGKRYFL